jgi:hypothetical protein
MLLTGDNAALPTFDTTLILARILADLAPTENVGGLHTRPFHATASGRVRRAERPPVSERSSSKRPL